MYLGYNVETTLGSLPRYDNELNIPSTTIPGSFQSVQLPTSPMMDSGSATLIYPIISEVGLIATVDGSEVQVSELPIGMIAPSMYVMAPVLQTSIPAGATISVVMIGVLPVLAIIICVAICATALAAIFVGQYFTSAWIQAEYYNAQEAYYDYLVECQRVITDETVDLNNDGVPDVRNIVWANGRSVSLAISEYGATYLGANYVLNEEGATADPPAEPAIPLDWGWIHIAGIAVIGLFVVSKMFSGSSQGGGIMVLK
jgi:hypothetical protein